MFELPVIVFFLARIGVLSDKTMKNYRKHAMVGVLFLSALITPPDVLSQLILSAPLFLLYEISIFVAKSVYKPPK